jgi:uncharacterized protein (TIGR03083 family)
VLEVAAHLASFLGVPMSGLVTRMVRAGFNPVRANAQSAAKWAVAGPDVITEALGTATVPGVAKVYAKVGLTEAVVHHQDIRRALDRPRVVPTDRLRVALNVIAKRPGTGTGGTRRRRGVTLTATDIDWSLGSGPEATGPAEAILMTLAGRRGAFGELSGDGTNVLARSLP